MKTTMFLFLIFGMMWGCESDVESSNKISKILNQTAEEAEENKDDNFEDEFNLTEGEQEIIDLVEDEKLNVEDLPEEVVEVVEEVEEEIEEIKEEITEEARERVIEEIYYFNVENGLCQDKNGNVGLNKSLDALPSGECLDLTNQMLSGDFDITQLLAPYGLDLSGATIAQALTAEFLLKYEIVIDQYTNFDIEEHLKAELMKQILKELAEKQGAIQETKNKLLDGLNKLKKWVAELEEVVAKGEYESGPFIIELSPEHIEKLQKEIDKANAKIDEAIEKVSKFELKLEYLDRLFTKL